VGSGVSVDVLIGVGVSAGDGIVVGVDVRVRVGVKLSVGGKLVDVEAGCREGDVEVSVGAGTCPL
jgi:hypothetical protein